jgi:hypothetical protein
LWVGLPLLAAGCGGDVKRSGPLPKDPPQVAAEKTSKHPLTGTLSCSGRGCHADFERPDVKDQPPSRFSYTRWLHDDPHARAYKVLFEPLAQEMGKKLGINVTEDARCLACHCTPQAAANEPWAREERSFGVGCEACHGPARDWLVPHRSEAWQKMQGPLAQEEYRGKGMNYLQALDVRAGVCAGCHVGAPADPKRGVPLRDMNHDFIAAGHPRLMFEFGSFLANVAKHWKEKDARADFEARVWLVGQPASARAALDLLADRASATAPDRVWPEFAEYDCYACHHEIAGRRWRQERGYDSHRPGALQPSTWYTALLGVVAGAASEPAPNLGALSKTLRRSYPPPADVRKEATAALEPLQALAASCQDATLDRPAIDRLRGKLVAQYAPGRFSAWDEVEQIALGLKALNAAERAMRKQGEQPSPREKEIDQATDELLKKLAFPPTANSPLALHFSAALDKELEAIFARLK